VTSDGVMLLLSAMKVHVLVLWFLGWEWGESICRCDTVSRDFIMK